jgi:hypothetical protein
MIGSTSDEGSLLTIISKPSEYVESTHKRFGSLAAKVLSLYRMAQMISKEDQ